MKKELTERELEELESALRSFGTPYASNEPDERYWANFRVKVFNRIDTKEVSLKRSVFAVVVDWFSASALRPIGAGLVTIAVVATLILSIPSMPTAPQISDATAPTAILPPPVAAIAEAPAVPSKITIEQPVAAMPIVKSNSIKSPAISKDQQLADAAGDFSTLDETLSGGRDDEPIDYSDLSDAELQSLVDVASAIN